MNNYYYDKFNELEKAMKEYKDLLSHKSELIDFLESIDKCLADKSISIRVECAYLYNESMVNANGFVNGLKELTERQLKLNEAELYHALSAIKSISSDVNEYDEVQTNE